MPETEPSPNPPAPSPRSLRWLWVGVVVALGAIHSTLAFLAVGGSSGLTSNDPLALHDHAIPQHNAWLSRPLLARTGLNAGYDPYFMSGYAKSLWSSPSSTVFEVAGFLTGGRSPIRVYKGTVLLLFASMPWLVAWAGAMLRLGGGAVASGVALFLLYVWTGGGGGGYPLSYALVGMTAYLACIPLAMVAAAAGVRYLKRGGAFRAVGALLVLALAFLVHVTTVLILAPAAVAACLATTKRERGRTFRVWTTLVTLPGAALMLNAFWVLPAAWLRVTRSRGAGFLSHSGPDDPVWWRLAKVVMVEPPIQAVSLGLGVLGLAVLSRRDRVAAAGLGGFASAGLAFGYLAGLTSRLDFLEPGRHTHALYSAACLLGGVGAAELARQIRSVGSRRVSLAALFAALLIGCQIFVPTLGRSFAYWLGLGARPAQAPFLASDPPPGYAAIVSTLRDLTEPGDRIFYEECGREVPGDPDPYQGGRYSGLLPQLLGIEVVGGPYLYVAIDTNFSQIGGGKFFGRDRWDRESFEKYAKVYRPTAIVCFTREARRFCLENPDLVQVARQDGRILIGKVVGFEGAAIRGRAVVRPEPGRLVVSAIEPDLDGMVVLRYHVAPGLRCVPAMRIVPLLMADDPVPFLGLVPEPGQTEAVLDIGFPPSL